MSLSFVDYIKYIKKLEIKETNVEILKRIFLLQNTRYYTKYINLIANNSKIDLIYCCLTKLLKDQKIIVIFAFLLVTLVFYNINTIVFYFYQNLDAFVI